MGTLFRLRLLAFLRPDTILTGGKLVSTEQLAHLISNLFYVAAVATVVLAAATLISLLRAKRRHGTSVRPKVGGKDCLFDGAEASGMQRELGLAQSSLSPGIRPYPTKTGLILASPLLGGGGILKSKTLTPQRCLPS